MNVLRKSLPTVSILVGELSNYYSLFWDFQDFLIYLAKCFWSILSSPNFIFPITVFHKSNVNRNSLISFVTIQRCYKLNFIFMEKKLAVTSFYYFAQEICRVNPPKSQGMKQWSVRHRESHAISLIYLLSQGIIVWSHVI